MSKASPSKDHPVSPDNSKSKEPKSKTGKSKRISVRLDSDAEAKLNSAIANGYTTSSFINDVIKGASVTNIQVEREVMKHVNQIQSEIEFERDYEILKNVREELNEICLALRSSLNHI